ncbi:MAG: gamma carbonic anhydrase family protein [Chloroflexota bacterium]|nr:gamma carbonic anhydrase family protein [Chloroflexota bacterium]
MPLYEFKDKRPCIHPEVAYISPSAIIIGDVRIGKDCSIFDNVVIEADVAPVIIGTGVNIQSQTVIHTSPDSITKIGDNVTIGHRAVIHAATIEDNATIGIGSLVATYSSIGKGAVIGEGSVVPQKKQIPANALAMGVPAKVIKTMSEEQEKYAIWIAEHYVMNGKERATSLKEINID